MGQIARVLQPVVPRLLQARRGRGLLAPNGIQGFVHQFHQVEAVEGDFCFGQVFPDALDEGWRQVAANIQDLLCLPSMLLQVLHEGSQGVAIAPHRSEKEAPQFKVHDEGDVAMPPAIRLLVDSYRLDHGEVLLGTGLVHVVFQNPPDARVVLPHQASNGIHRHFPHEDHEQAFEHEREAGALPGPRNVHGLDAVFVAVAARYPGRQVGRVLEEVQMPPGPFLGVVGLAWNSADRTREGRALLEVDPDVQPALAQIEVQRGYLPGGLKSECRLEKLVCVHPSI